MGCSSSKQPLEVMGDTLTALNPFDNKGDVKSRCNLMLRETTALAASLKRGEKDLRALSKAMDAALEGSRLVLESALPGVYDDAASAAPAALNRPASVGGGSYSAEQLAKARADLAVNIQADGFGPMDQWMAKVADATAKQKLVNKSYDEWDSLRKKVEAQRAKVESLRAKQADPKTAAQLQEAQRQMQVLEDKLKMASNKHAEEEGEQHARVSAINQEAGSLPGLIHAALHQLGAALLAARDAIGTGTGTSGALCPPPAVAAAVAAPAQQLDAAQVQRQQLMSSAPVTPAQ